VLQIHPRPYGHRSTYSNGGTPARNEGQPAASPRLSDFARRAAVAVLIAVTILAVVYFLWRGVDVLLQAFAGVLFAVFLAALADWVQRHTRLSYGWSLTLVVLVLFAGMGGLGYLLGNRLADQLGEMLQSLPRSFGEIRQYLAQYPWGKYLLDNAPQAASRMVESGQFSQVTGLISGVENFLEVALVILIVGIFGAAETELYRAGLLRLVPLHFRARAGETLDAIAFNLRHWLVGQVLLMLIIGTTSALGLWLIGIPLALTLGIMAGVLEVIPYIGAWLASVPAILVALLKSPEHAVFVLGLYLFLHLLEGYVLLPLIQRKEVHLPPALTLVAQVLLGKLAGILGLFVAAPLTVAALVTVQMLYVKDTLGDRTLDVPGEPTSQ
jgi:predicted PurR-regulated permease PerM